MSRCKLDVTLFSKQYQLGYMYLFLTFVIGGLYLIGSAGNISHVARVYVSIQIVYLHMSLGIST
jgi:hypothetical protein